MVPLSRHERRDVAARRRPVLFTSLPINSRSGVPLHRQVYERARVAILHGQLSASARPRSTRAPARTLGLSRNTVMLAYEQLLAEG
jgi:GntR family transcriptional regulator/MocR family aminotransferase